MILTLVTFILIGAAASALFRHIAPGTLAGLLSYWYLAGIVATGTILYILGLLRVPLTRITVLLILLAALISLAFRRVGGAARVRHAAGATLLLAAPLVLLVWMAAVFPIRDYDGRVTWLPKARAIAHEGAIDGPFFQGRAGLNLHNHYPLLLPLDGAAILLLAGGDDIETLRWLYVFIAVAACFAWRDLMAISQPRSAAWVVAAVAWLPVLVSVEGGALAAYSDVAMFALTGMAALLTHGGHRGSALFLAGLVLTKNEGIVLALAVLVSAAVLRRVRLGDWTAVLGASLLLLAWRQRVPAAYDEQYDVLIRTAPASLPRLPDALQALSTHGFDVRQWGFFWPFVIVSAVLAFSRRTMRGRAAALLVLLLLVLGTYTLTFTVTSWNIDELARVAASRLLLHLVIPAGVLVAMAAEPAGSS